MGSLAQLSLPQPALPFPGPLTWGCAPPLVELLNLSLNLPGHLFPLLICKLDEAFEDPIVAGLLRPPVVLPPFLGPGEKLLALGPLRRRVAWLPRHDPARRLPGPQSLSSANSARRSCFLSSAVYTTSLSGLTSGPRLLAG